jgi:ubiquinol-cytochrome c reductase cytochrome c1 subunit
LWELQGVRDAKFVEEKDPHDASKTVHKFVGFEKVTDGSLDQAAYDNQVGDLVAYLQWMGEPAQNTRKRLGVVVLIFMALLATLAWRLNASYWKEVK